MPGVIVRPLSGLVPRTRRTRLLLATAVIAACASNEDVKSAIVNKIIDNCYAADSVDVSSGSGVDVSGEAKLKDPSIDAKVGVVDGHHIIIKGLRPARRFQDSSNILRPTLAVAPDPSYSGPNTIGFGDLALSMGGQALTVAPDATALAALNAQKAANWSLVASAPIQLAPMQQEDVIGSMEWEAGFTLTQGRKAQPDFPYLGAFRMSDTEPFVILSLSEVEIELDPVTGFIMGNSGSVDATGDLSIAEGQSLELDHLLLWNDTNTAFSGTVELAATQGLSSISLWSSSVSVNGYASVDLGALSLTDAAALPSGDMDLAVIVRDSAGAIVSEHRNDLHVVGTAAALVLTGWGAEIDVSAGGETSFWIDGGAALAGEPYVLALSGTGGLPGMNVGGAQAPLVWDAFTDAGLSLVNTAFLPDALGTLDSNGHAETAFVAPAGVFTALGGVSLYFAPVLLGSVPGSSSAPYLVSLVP